MSGSLERHDRHRASSFSSFDDVQGLFSSTRASSLSSAALQELATLAHALEKLRAFMDFVSNEAQPPTDNTAFWGIVGLVLSQSEEGVAPRGPRMLRVVCENIELLNKYQDKAASQLELRDACFHLANSLLAFLIATIKFIREDVLYYSSDGNVWEPLEQQFNTLKHGIDETVSRLEKMSRLSGLDDLKQLQTVLTLSSSSPTQGPEEPATLPCFIYPTSKTPRFFDRTEDIIQMDRYFNNNVQDAIQAFRSLALYGIGGVGKSSIALRYAESRIHRKELDAMFWIASEKEVTIRQSFTDIALRLRLPNAQRKDHDQNRTLVLDWLQDTECRWLLIFDNVESADLLMTYWPAASRGQAVITTRNHNFAFYPADGGLEITEWDAETGSHFLIHLLSTDISNQLSKGEANSAYELSSKLSGHALALSLMAGLIHCRSWSIDEFNQIYERQPQKIHGQQVQGIFSNNSINAVWNMSFRSLNERASAILGVLTFFSPDSIPQALFECKDPGAFPDSLHFCQDPFDFSDEMETLMTLALVKRNRERRTFSVHRLVQTSFKHFMNPVDRQRSFNDAILLVSAAFPRKDSEFAQMYHSWKTCSLYLPHVLSLKDSFREERKTDGKFSALMLYCDMNNACQRYLIETNGYNDLLDLSEVNAMALATIPPQPHTIKVDIEGSLASHRGQVLERIGRVEEGITHLKLAHDLFCTDQPRNLREEAWCAENLADGIASSNNFAEAGMGTNLIWAGYNARARDVLIHGLNQLEAAKPYNWAMVAYTSYSLGTVDRADGNFESAEKYFTQAYNKWISGDNLGSDPFCGACVYRMGCAALDQGKVETAIKHLREAAIITERHKVKMPVEHARSLFKLSEALAREPRGEQKARNLRAESKRLLLSRSSSVNEPESEAAFDHLVFIWWR
ncbi:hypothetical protein NPX13_g2192 [Xylaria arbuscula]|uniref:NB-ARC domain-containing protein n=1 Tax=Xylaria arbuscula TaxID=114810 RepID=A0A9W8NL67_9PEZI|nr:hypothetical protein NPX13_g2192 [Xylaria arbuscula]